MLIHYLSALCGAGKTYQLIDKACELANQGFIVLFVQPTIELINKTIENELLTRHDAPLHIKFYREKGGGSVSRQLIQHLNEPPDCGHIVFVTHQVLPFIGFWPNRSDVHLVIDEALQVAKHDCLRIPITHRLITDYIEVFAYNSIYSQIVGMPEMEEIAKNEVRDQVQEFFRGPAQTLINPNWKSFVNTQQFEGLKDEDVKTLSVHSILRPQMLQGFASVTMASAKFEDTLIFNLWRNEGVDFKEDGGLNQKLRFSHHQNGSLVALKYLVEENWSKQLQNKSCEPEDPNGGTYLQGMADAIRKEFDGQPFVYQANKSAVDLSFGSNATRLPNLPHGLNYYSGYDRIAFLSAINPRSGHYRFLRTRGITDEAVRRALAYATAYQSVMRISIREPHNLNPKEAIVPDSGHAAYLAPLFPDCRIENVESRIPQSPVLRLVGRPRLHVSAAEKQAEYRRRKKAKKLREDLGCPYLLKESCCSGKSGSRYETGIDVITHFVTPETLCGSFLAHKKDETPFAWLHCEDVDLFLGFLLHFHRRVIPRKEATWLLTPAILQEGRSEEKIISVRHLWLDFEGGDLLPDQIARMFPHTRMVAFNSFRHTYEAPRFRVVIPLTKPVSPEEYRSLYDAIIAKFEHEGYNVRQRKGGLRSGLDLAGKSPTQLFYLPAQAQNPTQSFFRDYRDDKRAVLDPAVWLENNIIRLPDKCPTVKSETSQANEIDHAKVEEATRVWRQSPNHPRQGNRRFFLYAVSLRSAGMPLDQIESKLREEAEYGRCPDKRRRRIPSVIKTLRQPYRKAG